MDECFYGAGEVARDAAGVVRATATGAQVEWTRERNYLFRMGRLRERVVDWWDSINRLDNGSIISSRSSSSSGSSDSDCTSTQLRLPSLFSPSNSNSNANSQWLTAQVRAWLQCDATWQDASVSRCRARMPWALPVPGDEGQGVYVWFDALLSYLSAIETSGSSGSISIGSGSLGSSSSSESTLSTTTSTSTTTLSTTPSTTTTTNTSEYVHVLGKDIAKFHAVWWPALCLALHRPPPCRLVVHGHLLRAGTKMSKSLGNVICPLSLLGQDDSRVDDILDRVDTAKDTAKDTLDGVPREWRADLLRYYLLLTGRLDGDAECADDGPAALAHVYARDFAGGLGNLVTRLQSRALVGDGRLLRDLSGCGFDGTCLSVYLFCLSF